MDGSLAHFDGTPDAATAPTAVLVSEGSCPPLGQSDDPSRTTNSSLAHFDGTPDAATAPMAPSAPEGSYPAISRIDDPSALFGPGAGREIDPINAVVVGDSGTFPASVQLASQKIPADPPPIPEVIPMPEAVPMTIESGGPQGSEPFLVPPMGIFARWMSGPTKIGPSPDRGIGYERVAYAPFVLDITSPMTQWAFRIDAAHNWRYPDAAEYIFASPTALGGSGPAPQTKIDFQDFDFIGEIGNSSFSTRATIPVRSIDPETGGSTSGLGDVQVATKLVLLTGERWKVTQYMDFYIPSGSSSRGVGTGHLAIEPGLLASFRWSDETYIHAETKYLVPIPTSPGQAGTVFTWGCGISHLMYDGDAFAVIPTAELVCYSIFNASETVMNPVPASREIDDMTVPTLHLGCRVVSDRFRDLGTVEMGVSLGINLGTSNWYEELLRTEIRVMY